MTDSTNTPNGVRNGYLKDIKTKKNGDVPGLYTTDLSIENKEKLLKDYDVEGDAFSSDSGIAIVTGTDIQLGEVNLIVGNLEKDAPGKSYQEFKAEKMEKSRKAKQAREEAIKKNDKNHNGIDDRTE